ncbi:MAG: hypothetical protein KGJ80_12870, partial [Chloroflexota bacterium]|nr:hypothetical protein [Chloroflexota bacterium]
VGPIREIQPTETSSTSFSNIDASDFTPFVVGCSVGYLGLFIGEDAAKVDLADNVSRDCPTFNTPLTNGVFCLSQNVLLTEWKLYPAIGYTESGSKGDVPFGR